MDVMAVFWHEVIMHSAGIKFLHWKLMSKKFIIFLMPL